MPFHFDELAPHARDVCQRLADHYAVMELQLLSEQALAVVRASLQELQTYEKAIEAGNEPKPFRISLNVAQRHSRNLADMILERRNAHLCFYNDCNEELGELSPFKDDVVARRHGHLANYDLIEVKPSRRRAGGRRSGIGNRGLAVGGRSVGSLQSSAGSAQSAVGSLESSAGSAQSADGSLQSAAGSAQLAVGSLQSSAGSAQLADGSLQSSAGSDTAAGAHSSATAPETAGTPQDTGVEPSEEVRRLYSAWADAFEEWEEKGDKFAPLPEYPPELLEGMKELAEKDPAGYADLYRRGAYYVSHREKMIERISQYNRLKQAQGGAANATS